MTTQVVTHRVAVVLRLARIEFLLLPVALVAVGAAVSVYAGVFDSVRTTVALCGLLALHVAVNVLNDAADYESGIDLQTTPTPFSGGSGVLPAGHLSPTTAYRLGYLMVAVGAVIGAWFLAVVGPVFLPVLVPGIVFVLAYTRTLTKLTLGEIAAGLGLGTLPIIGVVLVQAGTVPDVALALSLPAFFLTFNLLLLNEFPDIVADRAAGRKNLIHRFGRKTAGILYVSAGLAVVVTLVGAIGLGVAPRGAALGLLGMAFFVRPAQWGLTPTGQPPTAVLRDNVLWNLVTNGLLAVGVYLSAIGIV